MKCMKCGCTIKHQQDDIIVIGDSPDEGIRSEAISSATCPKCKAEHHTRWIVESTWVVDDLYTKDAPSTSTIVKSGDGSVARCTHIQWLNCIRTKIKLPMPCGYLSNQTDCPDYKPKETEPEAEHEVVGEVSLPGRTKAGAYKTGGIESAKS